MKSSSLTWSTKYDTTITPIKYKTPPMVRSFDANNNGINFGSGQRAKGDNQPNSASRSTGCQMPCDDCALNKAGLILRWCEDCGSAVCDACILDRHPDHATFWYQEASRLADHKFDRFLEYGVRNMNQFRTERIKSQRFHHEVVTKLHDIKGKVFRREREAEEMSGVITGHWNEMKRLAEAGVNAKTICDRRNAAATSVSVGAALLKRQKVILKQLNGVDGIVSEMVNELHGRSVQEEDSVNSDDEEGYVV